MRANITEGYKTALDINRSTKNGEERLDKVKAKNTNIITSFTNKNNIFRSLKNIRLLYQI